MAPTAMTHSVIPLMNLLVAAASVVLGRAYRLPPRWLPAVSGWGLSAALWPAAVPAVQQDRWDLSQCLAATILCAVAVGQASRTRMAQLDPAWFDRFIAELEAQK